MIVHMRLWKGFALAIKQASQVRLQEVVWELHQFPVTSTATQCSSHGTFTSRNPEVTTWKNRNMTTHLRMLSKPPQGETHPRSSPEMIGQDVDSWGYAHSQQPHLSPAHSQEQYGTMHDELHRSSPQGLTNVNKIHSFTVDFAVLGFPNMADVPIGTGEIHHNNKKQQTN